MRTEIADKIRVAAVSVALKDVLNSDDITSLKHKAPILIHKIKSAPGDERSAIIAKMPVDDVRVLLAYVVSIRQNLSVKDGITPNLEDAAKILHKDVFEVPSSGKSAKKADKKLRGELQKQLSKVGIAVK